MLLYSLVIALIYAKIKEMSVHLLTHLFVRVVQNLQKFLHLKRDIYIYLGDNIYLGEEALEREETKMLNIKSASSLLLNETC